MDPWSILQSQASDHGGHEYSQRLFAAVGEIPSICLSDPDTDDSSIASIPPEIFFSTKVSRDGGGEVSNVRGEVQNSKAFLASKENQGDLNTASVGSLTKLEAKESVSDLGCSDALKFEKRDCASLSSMRHVSKNTTKCGQSSISNSQSAHGEKKSSLNIDLNLHHNQNFEVEVPTSRIAVLASPLTTVACLKMGEGIAKMYDSLELDGLLEEPND